MCDSTSEIPTIDLDHVSLHDLKHAAMRYGTFFITGQDVKAALRLSPFDETRSFFHEPLSSRQQWQSQQPGVLQGFGMSGRFAFGRNCQDTRQFYVVPPNHPRPQGMTEYTQTTIPRLYPNEIFAHSMDAYYDACRPLHMQVMSALAQCLDVEEAEFCHVSQQYTALLVANYYPKTPHQEGVMGIGAHQDGGLLTILNPEQGKRGLEIEVDGQWLPVTPRPGTLICNLGLAMHKLTNGKLNAIRHRVINGEEERQSIACFLHADHDAVLQPLPALVDAGTLPISAPELGAEHYVNFFRGVIPADKQTYGHLLAWQAIIRQARMLAAARMSSPLDMPALLGPRCSELLPRDAVIADAASPLTV